MEIDTSYDLIIVGSGNGACGFLSKYLEYDHARPPKILVLEAGKSFFETSDVTHQNNWTRSYAEGDIFQLHHAETRDGIPIISGRANTMGGGGSINYAMMHESSSWLSTHFGHSEDYWNDLKHELNQKFKCLDPATHATELTRYIFHVAETEGFVYQDLGHDGDHPPSYQDSSSGDDKHLYLFTTQFNRFGQRTQSGVSLVDWFSDRVEIKTECKVTHLEFDKADAGEARCKAVHAVYLDCKRKAQPDKFALNSTGRVILCAGAVTPRLLMPHKSQLKLNDKIGKQASDHIAIPIGIYLLNKKSSSTLEGLQEEDICLTPRDQYNPVFATTVWRPPEADQAINETVCTFEFFSGNFEDLWFFISHIYLAFLLPNFVKKCMAHRPRIFNYYKNFVRLLITNLNFLFKLAEGVNLITAIVKFNPAIAGEYSIKDDRIFLDFFKSSGQEKYDSIDMDVAEHVISQQLLPLMDKLGEKPNYLIRIIFWFIGIPFTQKKVKRYLDRYRKKYLLSQQHMSGGCLFGEVISKGINNPEDTGKVMGSANVYVADLSASPLPRISTQMTAYLIGYHVAKQLGRMN